ncbi:MAG: hypothetical protein IAC23_06300 [Bacteroidetes bacterium]|uniref:Outer membrane protein beta-barrel domain-containing protein n=1 Tax=Candidatus Cryptobacteroides merdavium TaxID=2840769 RepID=A0A9D9EC96_9BACT|nr:hypothetical protein [Candidatus Cryptobacteroides merdavium]
MKKLLLLMILMQAGPVLNAGNPDRPFPRMTFGVEGNFLLNFGAWRHFNYIADEGYRVNIKDFRSSANANGQLLANVGCNISRRVNIALYAGIAGLYEDKAAIPVSVRVTVLYGQNPLKCRWFSFADAGAGIGSFYEKDVSPFAKLGGGYRISLSRSVKLDFMIAYQLLASHPGVTEEIDGVPTPVTGTRLRRNDMLTNALSFGIGLNF